MTRLPQIREGRNGRITPSQRFRSRRDAPMIKAPLARKRAARRTRHPQHARPTEHGRSRKHRTAHAHGAPKHAEPNPQKTRSKGGKHEHTSRTVPSRVPRPGSHRRRGGGRGPRGLRAPVEHEHGRVGRKRLGRRVGIELEDPARGDHRVRPGDRLRRRGVRPRVRRHHRLPRTRRRGLPGRSRGEAARRDVRGRGQRGRHAQRLHPQGARRA